MNLIYNNFNICTSVMYKLKLNIFTKYNLDTFAAIYTSYF